MHNIWYIGLGLVIVAIICEIVRQVAKDESSARLADSNARLMEIKQGLERIRRERLRAFVDKWSDKAAPGSGKPASVVAVDMTLELDELFDEKP